MTLRHAEHIRQYSIASIEPSGWEIRLEEDRALIRHARCHDWHRVERTLAMFQIEVSTLIARGWEQIR